MRTWLCLVLLCLGTVAANSLIDWLESQYEIARMGFVRGLKSVSSASSRPTAAQRSTRSGTVPDRIFNKYQDVVPDGIPFPCDTKGPGARSASRPTSVHKLRPGDIDVIGAMGDSLTAGSGGAATRMAEVYIENRGMSWSIGGEGTWREYLTLPNILKEFNPKLVGYSLQDSFGFQRPSQFNVAEPMGIASDMPFQARLLVRRIRSDERVDFHNDWKMVTIMVGSNDFCTFMCYYSNISIVVEMHRKDLMDAIHYLQENLPRTLVNLVPPPDLKVIQEFIGKPVVCELIHKIECPCLFGERWKNRKEEFSSIMRAVQKAEMEIDNLKLSRVLIKKDLHNHQQKELTLCPLMGVYETNVAIVITREANDIRYSEQDDFAVVLQPLLTCAVIPSTTTATGAEVTDFTYLSEDCFHFSQKLLAVGANSLWNNLMEPVGNKTPTSLRIPFEKFLCPTDEHPYIYTAANS